MDLHATGTSVLSTCRTNRVKKFLQYTDFNSINVTGGRHFQRRLKIYESKIPGSSHGYIQVCLYFDKKSKKPVIFTTRYDVKNYDASTDVLFFTDGNYFFPKFSSSFSDPLLFENHYSRPLSRYEKPDISIMYDQTMYFVDMVRHFNLERFPKWYWCFAHMQNNSFIVQSLYYSVFDFLEPCLNLSVHIMPRSSFFRVPLQN